MARICREAGARVQTSVMVRDLDLGARRLGIIADGLPLWQGTQLAVDTALVSPIKADGTARRHAARRNGIALDAARRAKERKYPELAGRGGRAGLVVVSAEVGGRFSSDAVLCLPRFGVSLRLLMGRLLRLGCAGGAQCCAAWSPTLLHCPSSVEFRQELTVRFPPEATFWAQTGTRDVVLFLSAREHDAPALTVRCTLHPLYLKKKREISQGEVAPVQNCRRFHTNTDRDD